MPKLIITTRLEMTNGSAVYHDLAMQATEQELEEDLDAVRQELIAGFGRTLQSAELIQVSEMLLLNPRHVVRVHLLDMEVKEL